MMVEALASLSQIHKAIDLERLELEAQLGVPVCVPNCGKCCETVLAHRVEADFAISVMIGQAKFQEMVALCEGWLLERHKEAQIHEGPPFGMVRLEVATEWNSVKDIECAFLTSDKRCAIYSARPLVCRTFGVTQAGPAPDWCIRPLGVGESESRRGYIDNQELKQVVKAFLDGLPDKDWATMGWLPTIIYREACPEKYRALVADNRIASAKLIGLTEDYTLLWQEQIQAQWRRQVTQAAVSSVS